MKNALYGLLALATVSLSSTAVAQEAVPEFSFNLGVVSDYVYRGFSQSDSDAAVQGGVDLTYGNFYAGTWASTVEFGDGTDLEWDFYAGLTGSVSGLDYDLGVTYFNYVGDPDDSDYNMVEFKAGLTKTVEAFTFGGSVYYSPDFFGSEEEATYIEANVGYEINDRFNVSAGIGRQYLDIGDDYNSWNVGVGINLTEVVALDLRYYDSGVRSELSDARFVVGLGVAF